jgi:glycerol-3-phosphate cytidylyltransferase-like family protein
MFGTAFYVLVPIRFLGLLLLSAAVPLAYESVRRKVKKRVIYVDGTCERFNHETLKFWKQAKGLGSKLIVGIAKSDKDMIANASACESVDSVLVNAPDKISLAFMTKFGVDYVVCGVGNSESVVSSEIVAARRCLVIIDDGTCKPMDSKGGKSE